MPHCSPAECSIVGRTISYVPSEHNSTDTHSRVYSLQEVLHCTVMKKCSKEMLLLSVWMFSEVTLRTQHLCFQNNGRKELEYVPSENKRLPLRFLRQSQEVHEDWIGEVPHEKVVFGQTSELLPVETCLLCGPQGLWFDPQIR